MSQAAATSAETPHAIEAVEGSDVRIPCPQFREIQHPQRIRLVLWFKDNDTEPIARLVGLRRSDGFTQRHSTALEGIRRRQAGQ